MKLRFLAPFVWMSTLALVPAVSAQAETLRCNGAITGEGESRLAVLYKCGEPLLKDSYCAPWVQSGTLQPVPGAYAAAAPCQPIEEWVYDRGPGNLMATVRFKSGVVQSILYGRGPQTPTP
ncbi:DUF2845 domain-containing protein [Ideonella sp. DXS29W]|uniref:DUF2845 domain-containing protein n=1 Tax=Ideonella lacteola TaxID=2984193 RepID=A0ABU9BLF4_9BURK